MTPATETPLVDEGNAPPCPIGVVVDGPVRTQEQPADIGSYATWTFTGTEVPVMVLPEDPARVSGLIQCVSSADGAVVYVGTQAQCLQAAAGNTAAAGFILPAGSSLPVGHRQAVWVVPDGTNAASVSVANERRRLP